MILSNRRHRILYISLAAMDVACLLPYVLTWIYRARRWDEFPLRALSAQVLANPLALFVFCWLLMIGYMVAADLINRRQLDSPQREIVIIGLVIATSFAGIRLFLYPPTGVTDTGWMAETWATIVDFSEGITPPLLFILINAFLWLRVAMVADRELSFFGVGVSFRLGMLLSILGGALLSTVGGQDPGVSLIYLLLFFGFGLVAIALARIDEKAIGDTISPGTDVPPPRLAEISALTLTILALSVGIQTLIGPGLIRTIIGVFDPLWRAIGWILTWGLLALFLVIGPILERMMLALERLASDAEPIQPAIAPPLPTDFAGVETLMREWTVLRYCFVIGAAIAIVAVLWFFFIQPEEEQRAPDEEEPARNETRAGMAPGLPSLDKLREWLNLLRRYGASQRLLHAISVQNMYANISRLARRRGYPRLPSQPPDAYLPQLALAFPGEEPRLERMTAAYMRVHYGDLSIDEGELRELREDYVRITEAPPPQEEGKEIG